MTDRYPVGNAKCNNWLYKATFAPFSQKKIHEMLFFAMFLVVSVDAFFLRPIGRSLRDITISPGTNRSIRNLDCTYTDPYCFWQNVYKK